MEFRVVGIKISKIVNIGLKLRLTVQVFWDTLYKDTRSKLDKKEIKIF